MFIIRAETPGDATGVESLNDLGFGPDRLSRTVWQLRRGAMAEGLAFVATRVTTDPGADRAHGDLLATLRFWPVDGAGTASALLLGPLAVRPDLRGRGIGRALVRHGLQTACDQGWNLCLVSGEPEYYEPFGFRPAAPFGFTLPGPVRSGWFQVCELRAGALEALPADDDRLLQPRRGHRWGSGAADGRRVRIG